ncbi:acyl-CoA dehydrogenase/oxidase, partial [Globomyces pollinis-pini]
EILDKYRRLVIGSIVNEKPEIIWNSPDNISKVPYAEPSHMQGFHSPYYNQSHKDFRLAVRKFMRTEIYNDEVNKDDFNPPASREVYQKMGKAGLLAAKIGPGVHLKGYQQLTGVDPSKYDYFHELIVHEEMSNIGLPGYGDSLCSGLLIGLPPVLNFGSVELKKRVVPEILNGDKCICLAISEPAAGSDVAGMKTTAVKTPCGKFYIVNGVKKWITNGTFSDYFTTAVRTGDGPYELTMLLIERKHGVETKSIKTSHNTTTGTAYVIFENCKVPVENILGKEGGGFPVIMTNFNHERWAMIVCYLAACRLVIEECFKWANQREVFGKKLIGQPVIRNKLAHMVSKLESAHSWLENITYQMNNMNYKQQSKHLAGPIALLKMLTTRVCHDISDEAVQIFGGRAITKTGMGRIIEGFQRTYKFGAILGGSEEILADLGIKQAMRNFPNARL